MSKTIILLEDAAVTGSPIQWGGGDGSLQVFGTFDGATVSIQASLDGGTTYSTLVNGDLTESSIVNIALVSCLIKAAISGAGGSTSISVYIRQEERDEQL